MLAIAAELNLEVHQLDVKTAFLYADIEEEMYVNTAPGFETTNKDGVHLVMKLEKSLYGLARSPPNWWKTIDPKLIKIGFVTLSRSTPVAQLAPRNLLTRWDVSSIPANGIFLTKN